MNVRTWPNPVSFCPAPDVGSLGGERPYGQSMIRWGGCECWPSAAGVEPGLAPMLRRDLTRADRYKQIADDETGEARAVTTEDAMAAVELAGRFVVEIRRAPGSLPSSISAPP